MQRGTVTLIVIVVAKKNKCFNFRCHTERGAETAASRRIAAAKGRASGSSTLS